MDPDKHMYNTPGKNCSRIPELRGDFIQMKNGKKGRNKEHPSPGFATNCTESFLQRSKDAFRAKTNEPIRFSKDELVVRLGPCSGRNLRMTGFVFFFSHYSMSLFEVGELFICLSPS